MDQAMPLPAGFTWCPECRASREAWHIHDDPLEHLTPGELLAQLRAALKAAAQMRELNANCSCEVR